MIYVGFPVMMFRARSLFSVKNDMLTSKTISVIMGITPLKSGIAISETGTVARSEIIIATTSSDG